MMESSVKKKNLFYMIVLILTLVTMIIGATLAYFKFVASQKEESTVLYSGTLAVEYIDGTYIKNPTLYPIKNINYNTYDNVYRNNFAVTSTGTLDQTIWLDLYITRNDFSVNSLKYAIFNNEGIEMQRGNVPKEGKVNIASNLYLANKATTKYTLIIWLDDTDYNQNFEMGNIITGRIDVYAKQVRR